MRSWVTIRQLPRRWIEGELVAVSCIVDCLRALHDVQSQIEGVAAEDVAHVLAAHDHHLETGFVGDALETGRAHLARRPDRKPIAGDDERLTAVHARPKIGHQVTERAGLPSLIQRVEALGHTVGRRCDLIGIDGVELAAVARSGQLGIPEDECPAANQPRRLFVGWRGASEDRRDVAPGRDRPDGLCAYLTRS